MCSLETVGLEYIYIEYVTKMCKRQLSETYKKQSLSLNLWNINEIITETVFQYERKFSRLLYLKVAFVFQRNFSIFYFNLKDAFYLLFLVKYENMFIWLGWYIMHNVKDFMSKQCIFFKEGKQLFYNYFWKTIIIFQQMLLK